MVARRLILTMAVASAFTILGGLVVFMTPGSSSALTAMDVAAPRIPAPAPTPTQTTVPVDTKAMAQMKHVAAYAIPSPTHTVPKPVHKAPAPQASTPTETPTTQAPDPVDTATTSPSPTPTVTHTYAPRTGDLGAEILNKAITMTGVPYVYGGDTPSGFDCSGLIYWAALQLGINSMPRDTYEMLSQGVSSGVLVQTSSPSYGDLAFFGTGHVELYVKDGETFGAQHTGTDVGYHSYGPGYGPTMFYRVV